MPIPTALITHTRCLDHDTGPGHPERAARLSAILAALAAPEFASLGRYEAPQATREQLLRVHPPSHIDLIEEMIPAFGLAALDSDTVLSPASFDAALHAAGAGCLGVDLVMSGQAERVFCAVRPPGHHAEATRAMGFCLFSNIAITAAHAMEAHGVKKIAIVDFDVHHGNGTQDWARGNANVRFISSQQYPFWPGTGGAEETGEHGNLLNIPLTEGSGSAEFRAAYQAQVFPALTAYQPELLLISAGFDAHRDDPLAQINLVAEDYAWVTRELIKAASANRPSLPVISMLEGGYNLDALAESAAAHVRALLA